MSGEDKKRVYRKKEFWLGEIERFRGSGLSFSDYCRENDLATSTFSRKLQILGGDTPDCKTSGKQPAFIEVKTTALSALRLNFPSGISIDVPGACDTVMLGKIIDICRS
ncbi:MAG: hypothetical protein JXM68_07795 [Sedimentisphaerales bacterium]|nr:hypothetical protein [Sedimentisphaerales bacterium]